METDQRTTVIAIADPTVARRVAELVERQPDLGVVAVVSNAAFLLDAAERLQPDVAIVDQELPGMSGHEAAPLIRRWCAETAVILVTGSLDPRSLDDADGVTAAVSGFDIDELDAVLDALDSPTDRHRERTERRSGDERRRHQDWNQVSLERRQSRRRTPTVDEVARGAERRLGTDRRWHDDWNQVCSERRHAPRRHPAA